MTPFSLLSAGNLVHCPITSPISHNLCWKRSSSSFFFLFCLVGFFTDALIHPSLKSSRASNSRAALLPHLLLLRGQGQRGCGLLLHHFLKREKIKRKLLLLPPPLILSSISFNHDLPQLASLPPSLQPILLGCYSFSAPNLN